MFIDSHCHLHFFDFQTLGIDEAGLMQVIAAAEVEHMLCVATCPSQYPALQHWANTYQNIDISIGLHPNEAIAVEPEEQDYLKFMQDPKIVAIGETGLDYYRLQGEASVQQTRFRRQIRAAIAANKPLIIHTRDAAADTIRILTEEQAYKVGGVFHCFTGDIALAKQALDLNFVVSISGIVTFAKAYTVQEVATWLPMDKILIETDAPYLAPQPFRGKPNHPGYIQHTAMQIAKLKGIELQELAAFTTANYQRVFG